MKKNKLTHDPFNLIITGVGGQGNVLASRLLGNIFSEKGYFITIGETFGASQRGGSVMSHLRISTKGSLSPQIPKGMVQVVIALEPTEGLRVLTAYGCPETKAICNNRPIHGLSVLCGEQSYPAEADLKSWVTDLSAQSWFIKATDTAMEMGNPIFSNIILIGALAAIKALPFDRQDFKIAIKASMPDDKVENNLEAFDKGVAMIE